MTHGGFGRIRHVPTLRLLSYNIRALRDDGAAVSRVIRDADPHVVCIQEAPRLLRWRARTAAIARRSGLVVVAGGGGPAAGNLLLSSLAVDVVATHVVRFTKDQGLHLRATVIAVLHLAGRRFAVAGTHLDLAEAPRLRHVRELHTALDSYVPTDVPVIVAGDMNDDPGTPVWQALGARGRDAWAVAGSGAGLTSTAVQPSRRIDAVFVDERLPVLSAQVIGGADVLIASDHRPLLVEVGL